VQQAAAQAGLVQQVGEQVHGDLAFTYRDLYDLT
jgi:hypothetical protein